MIFRLSIIVLITALAGCRPSEERPRSSAGMPETPAASRPEPGNEPLETASIGDEEVQTLPSERVAPGAPAKGPLGPCSWSSVWQKDNIPNPHLAGVGGVAMPVKTSDKELLLPSRRPSETSEIHAEIIIGPFGAVLEATIVLASEPRWPEAEDAILATVRQWRYEPQTLDGKPITVCSTLMIDP